MSNQTNYDGILRSSDDYLAKAQTPPDNDTADGNGGGFSLGGSQGSIEIVAVVNSEVGVPDTKALTVKLQHSDDNSSYTDLATIYTITSSGGDTLAVGTELGRYILPTTAKRWVKAVIVTTGTVTGKLDVFNRYIAR